MILTTSHGVIPAAADVDCHSDGSLKACVPYAATVLETPLGRLIPQFTTDDVRRKTVQPVTFHPNGMLCAVPLEQRTVVDTPLGPMPAELVTLHGDGSLNRIFPLNGHLTGYWGQEDEGSLADPVTLDTPAGVVTARIIGASFYPGGGVRSITLWPGETVTVRTPVGELEARIGISFREDGTLRSLEPAKPQRIPTPVGEISVYDPDAVGLNGDVNSLAFGPTGAVQAVTTVLTAVSVAAADGVTYVFVPTSRESLCGDEEKEPVPMRIAFTRHSVTVCVSEDDPSMSFPLRTSVITTAAHFPMLAQPLGTLRCSV
ncbi:MAG: hypothetical protein AB7E47_07455 [Desulfovibrionaceae bacterium]